MAGSLELVVFDLEGQRYALPAAQVVELSRAVAPTPLPKAPPLVEGLIDFRGTAIPLIDVRERFGLPPAPIAETEHLIIARAGTRLIALRADSVVDVTSIDVGLVTDLNVLMRDVASGRGVARLADGLVLLHDLETFLSDEEAQLIDEALAPFENRLPSV